MPVRTTVEPMADHKVKLHIEVDASTFDKAVDDAFRKLATEVRIPGFRRGKVPRKILETRLGGAEALREQALKDSLPDFYQEALRAERIDAIAPPEIDNLSADEGNDISFDAVVEVRPRVDLGDWGSLTVTVPSPAPTDEEIESQVDRIRQQFGELEPVGRPAADGDFVTIDLRGSVHNEEVPGATAADLLYEVGTGGVVPKLDDELRGSRAGDILKFNDALPESFGDRAGEEVTFSVLVKEVSRRSLPDLDDEWVAEVSEFDSVDGLRADLSTRVELVKRVETAVAARDRVVDALTELVTGDLPESLVGQEMQHLVEGFFATLHRQNIEFPEYLRATGESEQEFLDQVRGRAVRAVKADLSLRSLAEAEAIEPTEEEIAAEVERIASRTDKKPAEVRRELDRAAAWEMLRSDIVKRAALELAVRTVTIKSEDGEVLDFDELLRAARGDDALESDTESGTEAAAAEEEPIT